MATGPGHLERIYGSYKSKNERRKAKTHQELDLARYDRDKIKGLFKHNNKRKTKDSVGLLLNGGGPG